MAALRRTKAGAFSLDQAIPLADLIADPDAASRLLGVDTLFAQYPAVTLTARQEQLCRNGAAFTMRGLPAGFVRVYGPVRRIFNAGPGNVMAGWPQKKASSR